MKSQWIELKETAIELRQVGQSLKTIHSSLGVPISTLGGWLKGIELTQEQQDRLRKNKEEAWERARHKAADWHRTQKALRTLKAKQEAKKTANNLSLTEETLDLVLAAVLFGSGSRKENTPISSSNPATMRLILRTLHINYGVKPETLRFDLSIRTDQDGEKIKDYWAKELGVEPSQFKSIIIDKRGISSLSTSTYKGVCILSFSSVSIQRKLRYLYNLLCERITDVDLGT